MMAVTQTLAQIGAVWGILFVNSLNRPGEEAVSESGVVGHD